MPELFRISGMRFFFFSNEHLPIHIHVKNADGSAKFEIKLVKLIENKGIKSKDIQLAESVIKENEGLIELRGKNILINKKSLYDSREKGLV